MNLIYLLFGVALGLLLVLFAVFIYYLISNIKCIKYHEEKHCNVCKMSFPEYDYIYCPYCGTRLSLHSSDDLFKEKYENSAIHYLKIKEEYYQAIKDGLKTFELRRNDRNYHVGDLIIFKRIVYSRGEVLTKGSEMLDIYKIDYILKNVPEYGLDNDYCILSISKCFQCEKETNVEFFELEEIGGKHNEENKV